MASGNSARTYGRALHARLSPWNITLKIVGPIWNHSGVQAEESLKVTAIGCEPCSAPRLARPSPGRTLQPRKDHSSGVAAGLQMFHAISSPALVSLHPHLLGEGWCGLHVTGLAK